MLDMSDGVPDLAITPYIRVIIKAVVIIGLSRVPLMERSRNSLCFRTEIMEQVTALVSFSL